MWPRVHGPRGHRPTFRFLPLAGVVILVVTSALLASFAPTVSAAHVGISCSGLVFSAVPTFPRNGTVKVSVSGGVSCELPIRVNYTDTDGQSQTVLLGQGNVSAVIRNLLPNHQHEMTFFTTDGDETHVLRHVSVFTHPAMPNVTTENVSSSAIWFSVAAAAHWPIDQLVVDCSLLGALPGTKHITYSVATDGSAALALNVSGLDTGCVYVLNVSAVSHGRWSDPFSHRFVTAVGFEVQALRGDLDAPTLLISRRDEAKCPLTIRVRREDVDDKRSSPAVSHVLDNGKVAIGGLSAGHEYRLSFHALTDGGETFLYQTVVPTAPRAPALTVLKNSSFEVLLSFEKPSSDLISTVNLSLVPWRCLARAKMLNQALPFPAEGDLMLANVSGLYPGCTYHLLATASRFQLQSRPIQAEFTTKPLPPTSFALDRDLAHDLFELRVSLSADSFQSDGCILQYGQASTVENRLLLTSKTCDFRPQLQPGRPWKFWFYANSGGVWSDALYREEFVEPFLNWQHVSVHSSMTGVRVCLNSDEAARRSFLVFVGHDGGVIVDVNDGVSSCRLSFTKPCTNCSGLVPGKCYAITLRPEVDGSVGGNRVRAHSRTLPCRLAFTVMPAPHAATFRATFPDQGLSVPPSCVTDDSYMFNVTLVSTGQQRARSVMISGQSLWSNDRSFSLTDLRPFTEYLVHTAMTVGLNANRCGILQTELEPLRFQTLEDVNFFHNFPKIPWYDGVTKKGIFSSCRHTVESSENQEDAPSAVELTHFRIENAYTASLAWTEPREPNGIIINYVVTFIPLNAPFVWKPWNVSVSNTTRSIISDMLIGGLTYRITVQAANSAGVGPVVGREVAMPLEKPPKPRGAVKVVPDASTYTSFTIEVNESMFSDHRNGIIQYFGIVVAETDGSWHESRSSNASWFQVQGTETWPEYVAVVLPLSASSQAVLKLEIGANFTCSRLVQSAVARLPFPVAYCNGPLRPGRSYSVRTRAYINETLFTDGNHTFASTLPEPSNSRLVPELVCLCVLIVLLVIALLAFIQTQGGTVLHLLKMCSSSPGCARAAADQLVVSAMQATTRLDKLCQKPLVRCSSPFVVNPDAMDTSRQVRKADFASHVDHMSSDSDFRFSEEFEDLRQIGRSQAMNAADMPCNRNKNRFTNILPYDRSRVKLAAADNEEGSDYINASYLPGFNSRREYIATQGPLPATTDDFWRMVWEQKCPAIVCLTRCYEKGREKCYQYWPSGTDPVIYGDVGVVIAKEIRLPHWTIRHFFVTRDDVRRTVEHFHFTYWPDFGVPENPKVLVDFVRTFRHTVVFDGHPIVVHCSAGVGRSGTFIALDRLLQSVDKTDVIDVFGVVHEMRLSRVWMVQTEQQYICIHQCLLYALSGWKEDKSFNETFESYHNNVAFEDDEGIAESGL